MNSSYNHGIEEEENPFMIPVPDNLNSKNIVDSLSYTIAQLFYYNFNIKDSAIVRFKDIVNKFPLSDYSLKSLIILDIEEPDPFIALTFFSFWL